MGRHGPGLWATHHARAQDHIRTVVLQRSQQARDLLRVKTAVAVEKNHHARALSCCHSRRTSIAITPTRLLDHPGPGCLRFLSRAVLRAMDTSHGPAVVAPP